MDQITTRSIRVNSSLLEEDILEAVTRWCDGNTRTMYTTLIICIASSDLTLMTDINKIWIVKSSRLENCTSRDVDDNMVFSLYLCLVV